MKSRITQTMPHSIPLVTCAKLITAAFEEIHPDPIHPPNQNDRTRDQNKRVKLFRKWPLSESISISRILGGSYVEIAHLDRSQNNLSIHQHESESDVLQCKREKNRTQSENTFTHLFATVRDIDDCIERLFVALIDRVEQKKYVFAHSSRISSPTKEISQPTIRPSYLK